MSSLLQQLPTLLGVVIGSFATYAVAMSAERSRWRRRLLVRWDERRLSAYMEYAHAVKKVISVATRLAAQRGVFAGGDDAAEVYGIPDLAEAEEKRTIAWEAVLMLGRDEVVIAARNWHNCVFRLQRIASEQPRDMTWREAVDATSLARRQFYEAARHDLGVAIGDTPEAYEWQFGKWMVEPPATSDVPSAAPKPTIR